MSMLSPNLEDMEEKLERAFRLLYDGAYEQLKELGDEIYSLVLENAYQHARIFGELGEIMKSTAFPLEQNRNLLEGIIMCLQEDSVREMQILNKIRDVQKEFGLTNAPKEE